MGKASPLVLINGAGTVGSRMADVLTSLGITPLLCKYKARERIVDGDEVKWGDLQFSTVELQELYANHSSTKFELFAARGSLLETRVTHLNDVGLNCKGSIDDAPWDRIDLVIDASPNSGVAWRNHNELYAPGKKRDRGVPFSVQGGHDSRLVDSLFFAGIPGTVVDDPEMQETYQSRNAKVVSCNTHAITTALALLRGVLAEEFPDMVDYIDLSFDRRHQDPNMGGERPLFTTGLEEKDYHLDELFSLLPATDGRAGSDVRKNTSEYFHNVGIIVDFREAIPRRVIDRYKVAIASYERAIFTDGPLGQERVAVAAAEAGIMDADIPFPVYRVDQPKRNSRKLKIHCLTPQRSIVSPSTVDHILMRTEGLTFREAFDKVNTQGCWRGHSFGHVMNSIQDNLSHYAHTSASEEEILRGAMRAYNGPK